MITGNVENGVDLSGPFATGNQLLANVIGLNSNQVLITSGGTNVQQLAERRSHQCGVEQHDRSQQPEPGQRHRGQRTRWHTRGKQRATGNAIEGNDIGVAPFTWTNYGNGGSGINLMGAPANTIGGTLMNSKSGQNLSSNVIGGNSQYGVENLGQSGVF